MTSALGIRRVSAQAKHTSAAMQVNSRRTALHNFQLLLPARCMKVKQAWGSDRSSRRRSTAHV